MYQHSTPAVRCARSARLPPLVTAHRSLALCSSFISFLTLDWQGPHFLYDIEPSLRYSSLETVISPEGRKPLLRQTTSKPHPPFAQQAQMLRPMPWVKRKSFEATPAIRTAGTLWIV